LSASAAEDILWRMMVKAFSSTLLKHILDPIDAHLAHNSGPHYAAFDADGTLWNSDVGENFFQYQIDHCALPALKGLDPWKHYLALKKNHPPDAYLWLAQICHPFPIDQVRTWAKATMATHPLEVLQPQKVLIAELLKRKIQVFVVSASTHWAVEAAINVVGLDDSSAVGVKTKVVSGKVTLEQDGPVTWREGKRAAILEKTKGIAPLFCSGNSSGDIHLLECASLVRLAVQTQTATSKHTALLADEGKLLALAQERGWLTHHFYE
jgi:phosphoserine phosphatase